MLQIKTTERGFELKNSQQKLVLAGDEISLGELTVSEAGEYEADGIEIVYGEQAALVVWEKLQIVYIFNSNKPTVFEKTQFSPCDVVIFNQSLSALNKGFFNDILEQYDPNIVIVSAKTNLDEIRSTVKTEPIELAKISDQTLPEESREFIVLA